MRNQKSMQKLALAALVATSTLVLLVGALWGIRGYNMSHNQSFTQSADPASYAVAGFPMSSQPAPNFTLTVQFGHAVTLSSLHGHEVVLAFIDARCKTLCPLTAQIMYDAKAQLGPTVANRIDLVAVNANPTATSIPTVQSWSINHGMRQWLLQA